MLKLFKFIVISNFYVFDAVSCFMIDQVFDEGLFVKA
jgi:hypothetical protein